MVHEIKATPICKQSNVVCAEWQRRRKLLVHNPTINWRVATDRVRRKMRERTTVCVVGVAVGVVEERRW